MSPSPILQTYARSSICLYPCTYVGVPLPNVEDTLVFSDDVFKSESFEHEWGGYVCPSEIDASCVPASEVAVKCPGISARPSFGFAKRTTEGASLGGIKKIPMLKGSTNMKINLRKIFINHSCH